MKTIALTFLVIIISAIASAQETKTTKSGYFIAVSEEALDLVIEYSTANDLRALQLLIDRNFVFPLKEGIEVYVVKSSIFSGKIEIRPKGYVKTGWTVKEAVH